MNSFNIRRARPVYINYFVILFLAACITTQSFTLAVTAATNADWTVLVFVQANNNLSPFAYKNFNDMAAVGSNQNLNILVEWHQPDQPGVWRYKVEKGKMILDVCLPIETDGNSTKDLVDSMSWAVTKFPAQKYSLILWNHGIGILDPLWGKSRPWAKSGVFPLDASVMQEAQKIQIQGVTTDYVLDATITNTRELVKNEQLEVILSEELTKLITQDNNNNDINRGILFNEHSKTYMDNQALVQALSEIKTKILKNKKIDLLGMDACLMAMVEVSYLARHYADYFVGSQEVELANGWNYLTFLSMIANNKVTPVQVAQNIVHSYELFYKEKINFYTQSAINLSRMDIIKESIDNVVSKIRTCQTENKAVMNDAIKKARLSCLQFSAANYIDLHSFYTELQKQLDNPVQPIPIKTSNNVKNLKISLAASMKVIEEAVIANVAGKNLSRARGLSIYFPQGIIDGSYARTDFAKECGWFDLIKDVSRN